MTSASGDVQTTSIDVACQSEPSTGSLDLLDYLPNEILSKVLRFLAAEDLCHLAECNKAWRNVTNTDSLWLRLCKLRDWERFGTEVDLRKEKTIQAAETSTSGSDPTFPADSVITGDCNLKDLAPTCEWKEVYMRAWHLNRNWSAGRYRERRVEMSTNSLSSVTDGRTIATYTGTCAVQLSDLSTGNILHEIELPTSPDDVGPLIIKHNIGVAAFKGGVLVFEARTGKELKLIRGTAVDFDQCKPLELFLEEDKIIVFYSQTITRNNELVRALIIWDISGLVEGGDNVHCTETKLNCFAADVNRYSKRYLACHEHFLLTTGFMNDTALVLWDTRMSQHVRMYKGHSFEVCCGHIRGNTIMTCDRYGKFKVWSVDSDVCLKTLSVNDDPNLHLRSIEHMRINDYGIATLQGAADTSVEMGIHFWMGNSLSFWNRDGLPLPGETMATFLSSDFEMHRNRLIIMPNSNEFSLWEVSAGKRILNRELTVSVSSILHIDDTKIVFRVKIRNEILILHFW